MLGRGLQILFLLLLSSAPPAIADDRHDTAPETAGEDKLDDEKDQEEDEAPGPVPEAAEPVFEEEAEKIEVEERRRDDASLIEDPETQRRVQAQTAAAIGETAEDFERTHLDVYGSARVHGVSAIDLKTDERTVKLSDGNSRVGVRADWQFRKAYFVYGRYEAGVDLVQNFSTRGDALGDGGVTTRLGFVGLDTPNLMLAYGQNWSAYYQVAGATDRFAIFGGSASGVYNAGTAGQSTGTGRAEDAFQARLYMNSERTLFRELKPFNLNVQYQRSQPIPGIEEGTRYENSYGASAFLETQTELGVGLAYNRARIPDNRPELAAVGIDGDATAFAVTTRAFGNRWYASLLYSRLKNMEFSDTGRYFDGRGIEAYGQWEFASRWWLIGGLNWLEPDSDAGVGDYRVRYLIFGGRYTFRSFERMLFLEVRIDEGRTTDGRPGRDEVSLGIRWDFGNQ